MSSGPVYRGFVLVEYLAQPNGVGRLLVPARLDLALVCWLYCTTSVRLRTRCRRRLREVAESNGERLLESSGNTISFAVTLDNLVRKVRLQRSWRPNVCTTVELSVRCTSVTGASSHSSTAVQFQFFSVAWSTFRVRQGQRHSTASSLVHPRLTRKNVLCRRAFYPRRFCLAFSPAIALL